MILKNFDQFILENNDKSRFTSNNNSLKCKELMDKYPTYLQISPEGSWLKTEKLLTPIITVSDNRFNIQLKDDSKSTIFEFRYYINNDGKNQFYLYREFDGNLLDTESIHNLADVINLLFIEINESDKVDKALRTLYNFFSDNGNGGYNTRHVEIQL